MQDDGQRGAQREEDLGAAEQDQHAAPERTPAAPTPPGPPGPGDRTRPGLRLDLHLGSRLRLRLDLCLGRCLRRCPRLGSRHRQQPSELKLSRRLGSLKAPAVVA